MTDRQIFLLDQFHRHELSDVEKTEFQAFLKSDAEFAQQVELNQDLTKVLEHEQLTQFKSKIDKWEAKYKGSKSGRRGLFVVLGIFIASILIYFIWQHNMHSISESDPAQLYAEYVQPYRNMYAPISRSDMDESIETKAMAAYENGEHNQAVELILSIPIKDRNEGLQFYLAVSHLMSDDELEAKALFDKIQNSKKYGVPSTWYLFLIALQNDQQSDIQQLGNRLQNQTTHPVISSKVSDILNRLPN